MDLRGKNVLVLGLGETGLSMAKWLKRRGATVTVADSRDNPPNLNELRAAVPDVQVRAGAFRAEAFAGVELIAISPGVPLAEPLVEQALRRGVSVVGDVELFAWALPQTDRPRLLAVTGSNGKTTVTAMVGEMCRRAGLRTEVAGNIGPAVLDALMRCQDAGGTPQAWVLELSSFQLETTSTLKADAAAVLNLSEDHLDRYPGMEAYAAAKARIFLGCGTRVLNREDARVMAMASPDTRRLTFGLDAPPAADDFGLIRKDGESWLAQGRRPLMKSAELAVAGMHNAANALAALALCHAIGLPSEPLVEALRAFKGLPHRVQKVAKIEGVEFYDDSKGTNVGATVAALSGMAQRVVLIAGGDGKGQDFAPLREPVAAHARAVVLIGRDAERIAAAVAGCGVPVHRATTMEDAVEKSFSEARPGDAVLLSPACASFDMFRNYAHRAEVFVEAVRKLGVV